MERDGIPRKGVLARMAHQWEEEKKIHLADFIIRNDGKEMVIPQVMEVHWKLAVGSRQ
jgi:dephospho-CoA kinase